MSKVLITASLIALIALPVALVSYQIFTVANAPLQGAANKAVANAERTSYTSTESYINGKNAELTQFIYEYEASDDPSTKKAMLERILESASQVDTTKLSPSIQLFLRSHQ